MITKVHRHCPSVIKGLAIVLERTDHDGLVLIGLAVPMDGAVDHAKQLEPELLPEMEDNEIFNKDQIEDRTPIAKLLGLRITFVK